MILGILIFGAVAAFTTHTALTNDRVVHLHRIPLSPRNAAIFYSFLAGLSALFVLAGLFRWIASMTNPGTVRLTATELSAPRTIFSLEATTIPIDEIVDIEIETLRLERFMNVYHRTG